ncbi:hypothetical protein [Mangrovicoccus sp. HB161399]|uniref:hypothetical protein n=1 Tax=Mangrovicoccus sp. HB161399 TaxID=2720392 RepID=UPI001556824E|nr:hypothetical protein [Mangrovicoccus sp. HB161399]
MRAPVTPINPRHKRLDEAAGALSRSGFLAAATGSLAAAAWKLSLIAGPVHHLWVLFALSALLFLGCAFMLFSLGTVWLVTAIFPEVDIGVRHGRSLSQRLTVAAFIILVMPFEIVLIFAGATGAGLVIDTVARL